MAAVVTPKSLFKSPDQTQLCLESDLPYNWQEAGWTQVAFRGQTLSRRLQLQYGIEVDGETVTIGHELDLQYLPTEEDHGDEPLNDPGE